MLHLLQYGHNQKRMYFLKAGKNQMMDTFIQSAQEEIEKRNRGRFSPPI